AVHEEFWDEEQRLGLEDAGAFAVLRNHARGWIKTQGREATEQDLLLLLRLALDYLSQSAASPSVAAPTEPAQAPLLAEGGTGSPQEGTQTLALEGDDWDALAPLTRGLLRFMAG